MATKTLGDQPVASVAHVVRHGEKLSIPEQMSLESAIDLIQRRIEYEQEVMEVKEKFDVFPWDGAVALHRVLTRLYGWAQAIPTPGFWGPEPPQMISVDVGPHGQKVQVPWGMFALPNIKGSIATSVAQESGRFVFAIEAKIKRESEATVLALLQEIRAETKATSIYRGKAIKIRFQNNSGDKLKMPEPKFLDTDAIDENMLVYSDSVMRAIETNLFTPIRRVKDCLANGIPVKRGVLLGGVFGTGKTLAAAVASKYAVQNGVTYLYVPRASELADAIAFAKQYQDPACVVFCEDIDRVTQGERSVAMDDLLNIIDGIDSKSSNILVVLTTNDLEKIHPAMLRPGRLDAVIEVTKPDGPAVAKLLRLYGDGAIAPETNLQRAGDILAGNIPAVIAEVVKRAKLSQIKYQEPGTLVTNLSEQAIVDSAESMKMQIALIDRHNSAPVKETTIDDLVRLAAKQGMNGNAEVIQDTYKKVDQLHDHLI